VTGGEPLAQPDCLLLLKALCDEGFTVSLETSGALSLEQVDQRVIRVIDIKTPDSGEAEKNLWQNLEYVLPQDQFKFVICSRADYEWACRQVEKHQLASEGREILFSPAVGQVEPEQLARWILEDRLPVRFQLQLHKIIWGDRQGV
jgi:7-carboxy-7-deazaguanine synthase